MFAAGCTRARCNTGELREKPARLSFLIRFLIRRKHDKHSLAGPSQNFSIQKVPTAPFAEAPRVAVDRPTVWQPNSVADIHSWILSRVRDGICTGFTTSMIIAIIEVTEPVVLTIAEARSRDCTQSIQSEGAYSDPCRQSEGAVS